MRWALELLLLSALVVTAEPLVLDGGTDLRVTVDDTGIAAVHLGERQVADGGLWAWDAAPWFGSGGMAAVAHNPHALGRGLPEHWPDRTVEALDGNRGRVVHRTADAVATWTLAVDGEDLTVTCRLENWAENTWRFPAMGGFWVDFGTPPRGRLPVWHASYLHAVKTGAFHPGNLNKIGGTWGQGDGFGVGTTPVPVRLERSLTFWDYESWATDRRGNDPRRVFAYIRTEEIPPGGALTFTFRLRFSTNSDWQHLLAPYREQVRATFGTADYATDHRLVAVEHVNRNFESIGPENPYGFHGGYRRLDLAEGVAALCDKLIPALQTANGQGVIFWGQGGQNPRGAMYRTDFDILPPEVAENWETMRQRFAEAGLKLGATTRPGQITLRKDWQTDAVYRINARDPRHLEMLTTRFRKMVERGCTMFYLDSFGSHFDDIIIMRHLRAELGPDIQTYAEHACDLIAPYTGFYSETDFWGAGSRKDITENHFNVRTGLRFLEVVRWLFGDVPCISRRYDVHGEIPADFEPVRTFFWRHRITPMISGYRLPPQAEELAARQADYVTETGAWKQPAATVIE